ncbi:acyltransferase family protein [Gluconacetobacter tumulisoli]|uniref:Acyltransferase n=1 Tax=Gluconacetobacter tumulisoli TaxID=1286189 RepID=A0A7W4K5Z0_9PROT|nr:acyltransferase [Gluconacetobacter tumulisoli]MBB2201014.1 acyltransferase [Gluconacetobacter tumulisoli]
MRRNIELDAVRGMAAFIVLLYHSWLTMPEPWHDMTEPASIWRVFRPGFLLHYTPLHLLVAGPGCVGLFFVLSGYVLSISQSGQRSGGYGRFVIRRICRIYVPFVAIILLSALAWGMVRPGAVPEASAWFSGGQWSDSPSIGILLGHLAMIGTPRLQSLDPPMWSLVIEMRISLIFPFLYMLLTRYRAMGVAAVAIVYLLSSATMSIMGESVPLSFGGSLLFTLEYMPLFALGIILHEERERLWNAYQAIPVVRRYAAVGPLVMLLIAVRQCGMWLVVVLLGIPSIGPETTVGMVKKLAWLVTVGGGSVAVIMLAIHSHHGARILVLRPFQWLGTISYSLYLAHMPVLMAMVHLLHGRLPIPAILGLSIILSLAVAALCFRWIEEPAIALGRRLTRSRLHMPGHAVPQPAK